MKTLSKLLLVFCFLVFAGVNAEAHDPDQFSYQFTKGKTSNELQIHLTPKSAFDLILSLRPELSDTSVIRLKDYTVDFAEYFNKTIALMVQGKKVEFLLYAADLVQHDATINFQIDGYAGDFDNFNLTITSFTELYRHTENHVEIPISKGALSFILDGNKTSYSQMNVAVGNSLLWNLPTIYLLAILLVVLFMSFLAFYLKKRRLSN